MSEHRRSERSKSHAFRDTLGRSFSRVKNAITRSSRPSSPHPGGLAALLVDMQSPSPMKSQTTDQINDVQPTSHQMQDVDMQSPGSLVPTISPASTAVNTASSAITRPIAVDTLKEAGNTAWTSLETALRVLEKSMDAFPPLKSAVGELVTCLDVIQTAAANRGDYEHLATELRIMSGTLSQYVAELASEEGNSSVLHIVGSIKAQVAHIDKQRFRGKAKMMLESTQDKEDVVQCYQNIQALFRQLQNDLSLRTWRNTNKQFVMALLQRTSPADDARYNSSYSTIVKRRGCTPETREKVRETLQAWVRDPSAPKVYWMNGMAGTGKTTIAYDLCEWLENKKQLGASFFCSRPSASCNNLNRMVPTIAYQLAKYSPAFRSALCKILDEDPDVGTLDVVRQFRKLIQDPLSEVKDAIPDGVIVAIDALDECEDSHGVRLMLDVLLRYAANLPLKFFVTSRPEPRIRDRMTAPGGYSPSVLHLHDIEQSVVEEDIKKYLIEALDSLSPPPSRNEIERLAKRAGKLFIYAATAVRYILPDDVDVDPSARLQTMLENDLKTHGAERPNRRYEELDELYRTILTAAFGKHLEHNERNNRQLVLWTAICAREPLTAQALASLLGLTERQVSSALLPLQSVLHVSEQSGLISTLHTSFPDYMLDHMRSVEFHCDEAQHSHLLAKRCFELMKEQLRFNICDLQSSFILDSDVPMMADRVKQAIPPALFYACRHWGEHLRLANVSEELHSMLSEFLLQRLLFWMEVLNLRKCIGTGATILFQAQSWLSTNRISGYTGTHIADARNFVTQFAASACSLGTPHLYMSALAFCPRKSSVYEHYWGHTRGVMNVKGTMIRQRELAALAIWGTSTGVHAVAFSPDGGRIVTGLYDGNVWVRDAHTGAVLAGPFEGHTDRVWSISFSPDGHRIVSGSRDRTIRVWDSHTGDLVAGPFQGHADFIWSAAFSPDGTRIVLGADDHTAQVWDSHTGDLVAGPFQGHTDWVRSVAFSPDGTRIVSGSDDSTIRVWNSHTGDSIAGPFNGHTDGVKSVAFSPNGTQIVSGSDDRTIRVWDSYTGEVIAGPFEGHSDLIRSAVFSPDGNRIVSGSRDLTIRVWDSHTGDIVAGPLNGHTGGVWSVVFSPDGTRIISGADDCTVRVWASHASDVAQVPGSFNGHTNLISAVVFSPDGTRIVSGSDDHTVRVWDAQTGDLVAGPFLGHTDSVYAVSFSPDGGRIASGSDDRTLRVWDSQTGDLITGPCSGHTNLINSVAFSPDSNYIASCSDDCTIRVWDSSTGDAVAGPCNGHTDSVYSVSFSPDGTQVVSGSDDRTIRVWASYTGNLIAGPFQGHTDSVRSVAFSPDGAYIVSGSWDRTIRVWSSRAGGVIAEPFEGHTNSVYSVAFSPDGTRIFSGSYDCTIRVWDTQSGTVVEGPFYLRDGRAPAFSPDGTRAVFISNSSRTRSLIRISILTQQHSLHTSMQGRWNFTHDGWVTNDTTPLFWVPPDLHELLPCPPATLSIHPQGSVQIDYSNLVLGERWFECFSSQ